MEICQRRIFWESLAKRNMKGLVKRSRKSTVKDCMKSSEKSFVKTFVKSFVNYVPSPIIGGDCTSESRRNRIKSEIVLLGTESDLNNIRCISIPFDESVPAYYAISYRWGTHPEWKVQTPNYTASITSISRGNLIKLCKLYRHRIRYIWIDVVCINQADKEHRKMAIKNMDNIYQRAKRIIAVPDLCYCKSNPLMEDVMKEDIEAAIIWLGTNCPLKTYESPECCKLFDKNKPGTYLGY